MGSKWETEEPSNRDLYFPEAGSSRSLMAAYKRFGHIYTGCAFEDVSDSHHALRARIWWRCNVWPGEHGLRENFGWMQFHSAGLTPVGGMRSKGLS